MPSLTGALDMSSSGGGLEFWMEGFPSVWGLPVQQETSSNVPFAKLYTATRMDVAADFTMDIWVEALATVGVVQLGLHSLVQFEFG